MTVRTALLATIVVLFSCLQISNAADPKPSFDPALFQAMKYRSIGPYRGGRVTPIWIFDWASHDKVVMSGGYINPDSIMFASHAIISDIYANLNLRFGYHFVVLDAVCGPDDADNHILLRFSGGGADVEKRRLRALFLHRAFQRLGFDVTRKSDLIDARHGADSQPNIERTLDLTGRLLGATRLMDMYLKDERMADAYVDEFMAGRYHFSNVEL